MKVLVVYYSRTGNTKKVAEMLAVKQGYDIEEIKSIKSYAGSLGWTLAGKEGSQKVNAKIKPTEKNPADYDLVVLGTPIWAWNISSPIRAYLAMNKDKIKKIAAFCTCGGSAGNWIQEIEEASGKTLEAKAELIDKDILDGQIKLDNFLKEEQNKKIKN